jgi:hypothetical protein
LKIIAMSSRPEVEQQVKETGVQTFLSKSESPERVMAVIRTQLSSQSKLGVV